MKIRSAVIVFVGLAILFVASLWYFGRQANDYLAAPKAVISGNPYLKLVGKQTDSGIFESTETETYDLKIPQPTHPGGTAGGGAAASPRTIHITARSVIKHGPLPGLSTAGAATIHTELFFGDQPSDVIKQLYGGKALVTVDTLIGFSGGGHQEIRSPAVDAVLKDKSHVSWGEIHIVDDFKPHWAAYKVSGGMPFLKVEAPDGKGTVEVGAITLSGNQTRLFKDDDYLYSGPFNIAIAKLAAQGAGQPPMTAEQIQFGGNTVDNDGFLDMSASYGVESLMFGPKNFGPARLDLAFRHIHAKSLSEFNRQYLKLVADGAPFKPGKAPDPKEIKALAERAQAILSKSPEFDIDKLSITLPTGTVDSRLAVRLPNADVGNLQNAVADPLVVKRLMASIEAKGQVAMPESTALSLAGPQRAGMIGQLIQAGYVSRQNGMLSTRFEYTSAGVAVNGKRIDPAALAGRPQGQ